jgi:uncharacterized protein
MTAPSFQPPTPAASLYLGDVMHARMKPKGHRFNYSVYSLLIDLDRLDQAHKASRLFSVSRFNVMAFHEKDHGPEDGSPLAQHARDLLAASGSTCTVSRVLLLCYPRIFGYTFNPIAVYFLYDVTNTLVGVIYEVRNTFGEKHTYVAPVREGELSEAGLRQERDKLFHVSPFMGMAMRYRFRIRPPSGDVALRILETDEQGPILAASFIGRQSGFGTASIIKAFLRIPLLTFKIVGGIHWEAMKLWFKGIRFHRSPPPPPPFSVDGQFQMRKQVQEMQT